MTGGPFVLIDIASREPILIADERRIPFGDFTAAIITGVDRPSADPPEGLVHYAHIGGGARTCTPDSISACFEIGGAAMMQAPATNRHDRRRRLAFGKAAGVLLTDLFPRDASLAAHPHARTVSRAVADLYASGPRTCFCCFEVFDPTEAGALLSAISPKHPTTAAISAMCPGCWQELSDLEIDECAARVLRTALPQGKFLSGATEP